MVAKCPICKIQKMKFGGMAALDGSYCGKCYDKALAKGLDSKEINKLKVYEIAEYIEDVSPEDTTKWLSGIKEQRNTTKKNSEIRLPFLEEFRGSISEYFAYPGPKENSSLQNYATQIFWHVNCLRKDRLLKRGIQVIEDTKHDTIESIDEYQEKLFFDGKYEICQMTETINGNVRFLRDEETIFKKENYNQAQYTLQKLHKTDNGAIVCPSCGAESSRSNLIDGCDFCGTKFTVEDLTDRISDYHIKKNIDIKNTAFIYTDKGDKAGTIICALILFLLGFALGIFPSIPSMIGFVILSPVLGFLVYYFIFKFIIMIFNMFRGNHQSTQEYEREEARRNETILEKIRSYDPLFTSEELYAEVGNILTAHYYADSAVQVRAFWEKEDEDELKRILKDNQNIIDSEILLLSIKDYFVEGGFQNITLAADVALLENTENKIKTKTDQLNIKLIKSADCKTQAVCGPKLLSCPSCGSSISFMEGLRCNYCGNGPKLSEIGWTLVGINIKRY